MKTCIICGIPIKKGKLYCSNCKGKYHRCRVCGTFKHRHSVCPKCHKPKQYPNMIGTLCRSGAKKISLAIIKQAISDKDFHFLYSSYSNLFFDLAEIQRSKLMDKCFDDDLNRI